MKKFTALFLALVMVLAVAGCASGDETPTTVAPTETSTEAPTEVATEAPTEAPTEAEVKVMSYDEFVAAEVDSEVVVETYVQAKQGWWENKANVYTQNEDGAFFIYGLACTEEEYAQLTEGAKIRVTGYKAEFSGEIEITDATFELLEGNYVAETLDVTAMMANEEELLAHQNQKIAVNGLTVEKVEYKNDEPGDDIYVTLGLDGASYNFCVEVYLTGTESEVYTTVGELNVGDVVNVEGFLYWYEGPNAHITSITVVE